MPRPSIRPSERVRGAKLNLHPSTWEALRRLAFEERTTISEQVRRAVDEYLAKRQVRRLQAGKALSINAGLHRPPVGQKAGPSAKRGKKRVP